MRLCILLGCTPQGTPALPSIKLAHAPDKNPLGMWLFSALASQNVVLASSWLAVLASATSCLQ